MLAHRLSDKFALFAQAAIFTKPALDVLAYEINQSRGYPLCSKMV